ncbi:alpha/beta fold hydrolase [Leifsonia sp. 22587]|uniref:alpha/beta fold hydrolase n=1 Tax=Leifsonia sp. 22587 TaxID=3453946 RepID=UPI003F8593D7
MPNINTMHGPIHYDEFGDPNLPPLLLVHGLMGDASTVAPIAEKLSNRFRVITPDALGHGKSARPESFTIQDQGHMLVDLAARLGYQSANLVGISMGSYLAAQAAILAPDRIKRLVLVVSKAHGTTSSVADYAARRGVDLGALSPQETMAVMSEAIWSPHTAQEKRDRILSSAAVRSPLSADEQAIVEQSLAGFDLRPGLHLITAPTLVLAGAADGLNPPEAGRELAAHIPGSRFAVYERSGHMLAYEEQERLINDITAFLTPLAQH